MRAVKYHAISIAILMIFAQIAQGQEREVFFLPCDQDTVDDLTVAGTSEITLSNGLSKLSVPGSSKVYYVVDEAAAVSDELADSLSDVWTNDSDISIAFHSPIRSHVAYFHISGETPHTRFLKFEHGLKLQLRQSLKAGRCAGEAKDTRFYEYQFPLSGCSGLREEVDSLIDTLQQSTNRIGERKKPTPKGGLEEIVVDGISYRLNVKLGPFLQIHSDVGPNSSALHDHLGSIMETVRSCHTSAEPKIRTLGFW